MILYGAAYLATLAVFVLADMIWLSTMASRLYRPTLGDIALSGVKPSTGIRILHSLSGGACRLCHHARAEGREYLNGALLRRTFRVFHLRDL